MNSVAHETFGQYLRRLRRDLGLTQEELAEKIGKRKQLISNFERSHKHIGGTVAKPSVTTAQLLAKVLHRPELEMLEKAGLITTHDASKFDYLPTPSVLLLAVQLYDSLPTQRREDLDALLPMLMRIIKQSPQFETMALSTSEVGEFEK